MNEPARLYAVAAESDSAPTLVLFPEGHWVTETPTGLIFEDDTPLEIVGEIITRLTRQHKRIEWALGDAMNFAERRYGDTYAQYADETGLSENTLATIKWVAGAIESSRRREDVGWSHHREVAPLSPDLQDSLLEEAADKGLTRYQVRVAAQLLQDEGRGKAQTAEGEPICAAEMPWRPGREDLTDEARAALDYRLAEMGQRHAVGFAAGFIAGLVWLQQEDCFTDWRG